MNSFFKWTLALLVALPCFAQGSEIAILRNGFSIPHEHHAVIGTATRLYTSVDGSYIDIPTAQIDHFEQDLRPAAVVPAKKLAVAPIAPLTSTSLNGMVNEAGGRHNIDPDLLLSVIRAESDFKVHAVSPKGAQGLMQLMPRTANRLGVANAFDPGSNVEGGTRYLRELLEKYNFDLAKALAAYNAGPMRVQQYGGVPPYYETRAYVARIIRDYNRKKLAEMQVAKNNKKAPAHSTSHPLLADSKQQSSARPATVHATQ
ncbi:MAG TPA: lytic transglycosylase domain-containing protein [Terriglobales bacterium]